MRSVKKTIEQSEQERSASVLTDDQVDRIAELIANRVVEKLQHKLAAKWISRQQYAEMTSLSVQTVGRMMKDGRLKYRREGRRVLIEAP